MKDRLGELRLENEVVAARILFLAGDLSVPVRILLSDEIVFSENGWVQRQPDDSYHILDYKRFWGELGDKREYF